MQADYIQVIEGLAQKGHQLYVFLHKKPIYWKPISDRIKIFTITEWFKLDRFSPINLMSTSAALLIKKKNIDVIYATGTRIGEGLISGILSQKPVLVDVRNPWSVQGSDFLKDKTKKTVIGYSIRRNKLRMEELLIHRAKRITSYSKGIKLWLENTLNIKSNIIKIIGPHVNLEKFESKKKSKKLITKYKLSDSKILMYVGVIDPGRGLETAIEALAMAKLSTGQSIKLVIVGPIDTSNSKKHIGLLEEKIRKLDVVNDVVFTGIVPFNQIQDYTSIADIFLVPHKDCFTYRISPPVKVVEYMASGKPIITTNVGISDFLSHNNSALIVEPEDSVQMAKSIINIIRSKDLSNKLSKNAYNIAYRNHNLDNMVDKFEKELISTK